MADGVLQGYSAVLNLNLRWDRGELRWYDPATGRHITTFVDERDRADRAETELRAERETRAATETRLRELEAEVRRLRGE